MTGSIKGALGLLLLLLLGLLLAGCPEEGGGTQAGTIEDDMPDQPGAPGPSLVSVEGRQLLVRKRRADGTLALAQAYSIRGVVWAPASRETDTSPTDPRNAAVRRQEFETWFRIDIPLMAAMHVNTVRMVIDPGVEADEVPIGRMVLDELYRHGMMVIMTVDDGINDLDRVLRAVNAYKDHPAILLWGLGSEWNLNLYFGVATSVEEAAERTEAAAALIHALDPNHPVSTSYGDIDIDADGLRLSDTQRYVNTVAPGVDVWGLHIFRGSSFGSVFAQWASSTDRPMFLGECSATLALCRRYGTVWPASTNVVPRSLEETDASNTCPAHCCA